MNLSNLKPLRDLSNDEIKHLIAHNGPLRECLEREAIRQEDSYLADEVLVEFDKAGANVECSLDGEWTTIKWDLSNLHPFLTALCHIQENYCYLDAEGERLILKYAAALAKADVVSKYNESENRYLYPNDDAIDEAIMILDQIHDKFITQIRESYKNATKPDVLIDYFDCFVENHASDLFYDPTDCSVYDLKKLTPEDF